MNRQEITFNLDELQAILIQSELAKAKIKKTVLTRRGANEEYGERVIDTLIANNLLKPADLLGHTRFYVSDIISAQQAMKKL